MKNNTKKLIAICLIIVSVCAVINAYAAVVLKDDAGGHVHKFDEFWDSYNKPSQNLHINVYRCSCGKTERWYSSIDPSRPAGNID